MGGPASRAVDAIVVRGAVTLRILTIGFVLCAAAVWGRWYVAVPWRLVGPLAWVAFAVYYLREIRRGGLTRRLVYLDVTVGMVSGLAGGPFVPPNAVGDASNWVFVAVGLGALSAAWHFVPAVSAPLLVLLGASFAVGTHMEGTAGPAPGYALRSLVLLATICGVWVVAVAVLRRRAAVADESFARVGAERAAAAVDAARAHDRRELERVVHDTVLNTLTGIAWGGAGTPGDPDIARHRCGRDLAVLTKLLDSPVDVQRAVRLLHRLRDVVADAGVDGLAVTLRGAQGDPMPADAPVPVAVAESVAGALREALANVRRHAGVSRAEVTLARRGGGVRIAVTDRGVGFSPAAVPADRLGITRSIRDRLADVGGTARVISAPGRGTTVELDWPANHG